MASCLDEEWSPDFPMIEPSPTQPAQSLSEEPSDGPPFTEQDRVREATMVAYIHSKREEALKRHAAKLHAYQITAPPQEKYLNVADSSRRSSSAHIDFCPTGTPGVPLVDTLPLACTPRRRLKRDFSALTDKDGAETPYVPVRRRIQGKQACVGPEWPVSFSSQDALPVIDNSVGDTEPADQPPVGLPGLDTSSGILEDEFIATALSGVTAQVLESKLVNRMACRTLLRGGVVRHCKDVLLHKLKSNSLAAGSEGLTVGKRLQWAASQYLTSMTVPQRCRLYRCLIEDLRLANKDEQLVNFLCHIHRSEKRFTDDADDKNYWLKAKVSILTYQGSWGVVPWTGELRGCKDDLKRLCVQLGKLSQVRTLFDDLMSLCSDVRGEFALKNISCSLELCVKTLQQDDILRVHAHIALEAKYGRQVRVKHASRLVFRTSRPVKQAGENDSIQTRSANAGPSAHYYLRMPKIGKIVCWGTHQPFVDYRINPDWISSYVQACKVLPEDAKVEFSKTWKNCKMYIENIDWNVEWRRKQALAAQVKEQQASIQCVRACRKYFHEVDEVWLPLMGESADRHPVLVLGGQSRTGKTTFCKLLSTPTGYLEINCKGLKVQANLRHVTQHTELINFDEASLSWCLENKKILQGPELPVTMGDSATGMYAYEVMLNGIKMVVCSNTWSAELSKLRSPEDRDYIAQNFIYVDCNELMYELPYF
jgi:hypothetical protein